MLNHKKNERRGKFQTESPFSNVKIKSSDKKMDNYCHISELQLVQAFSYVEKDG